MSGAHGPRREAVRRVGVAPRKATIGLHEAVPVALRDPGVSGNRRRSGGRLDRATRLHTSAGPRQRGGPGRARATPPRRRAWRSVRSARWPGRSRRGSGKEYAAIFQAHALFLRDPSFLGPIEKKVRAEKVNAEWAVEVVAEALGGPVAGPPRPGPRPSRVRSRRRRHDPEEEPRGGRCGHRPARLADRRLVRSRRRRADAVRRRSDPARQGRRVRHGTRGKDVARGDPGALVRPARRRRGPEAPRLRRGRRPPDRRRTRGGRLAGAVGRRARTLPGASGTGRDARGRRSRSGASPAPPERGTAKTSPSGRTSSSPARSPTSSSTARTESGSSGPSSSTSRPPGSSSRTRRPRPPSTGRSSRSSRPGRSSSGRTTSAARKGRATCRGPRRTRSSASAGSGSASATPRCSATQLRALLSVASAGDLRILVPMVAGVEEMRRVRAFVEEAREELLERGVEVPDHVPIGAMIEVPSAADHGRPHRPRGRFPLPRHERPDPVHARGGPRERGGLGHLPAAPSGDPPPRGERPARRRTLPGSPCRSAARWPPTRPSSSSCSVSESGSSRWARARFRS